MPRTMKRIRILASLLVLPSMAVACSTPLGPSLSCDVPDLDTSDWQSITSRYGVFSLLLPSGAVETDARCIDSACGIIDVGDWELEYDMGELAGPGNSYVDPDPTVAELADRCTYQLDQRSLFVTTYRFTTDTTKVVSQIAGKIGARAATELVPDRGLYFDIYTDSVAHLREFIRAITTTEIDYGE